MLNKKNNINMTTYFKNENKNKKVAFCVVIPFSKDFKIMEEGTILDDWTIKDFQIDKFIISKEDYENLLIKTTQHKI